MHIYCYSKFAVSFVYIKYFQMKQKRKQLKKEGKPQDIPEDQPESVSSVKIVIL